MASWYSQPIPSVDTLRLELDKYVVEPGTEFPIFPVGRPGKHGRPFTENVFFTDLAGEEYKGSRASGKTPTGEMKAFFRQTEKGSRDYSRLIVDLTVPKYFRQANLGTVRLPDLKQALHQAEQDLLRLWKIRTRLNEADVTRIDFSVDAILDNPFNDYMNTLANFEIDLLSWRVQVPTRFNRKRTALLRIYNKFDELSKNGHDLRDIHPNTYRFELRLYKTDTVDSVLSCSTVKDLLNNYPLVINTLKNLIKPTAPPRFAILALPDKSGFEQVANDFKDLNPSRNTKARYLKLLGLCFLHSHFLGIDEISAVLARVFSKQGQARDNARNRTLKEMATAKELYDLFIDHQYLFTDALYQELKQKVAFFG